jgi:hypothetical protein
LQFCKKETKATEKTAAKEEEQSRRNNMTSTVAHQIVEIGRSGIQSWIEVGGGSGGGEKVGKECAAASS